MTSTQSALVLPEKECLSSGKVIGKVDFQRVVRGK